MENIKDHTPKITTFQITPAMKRAMLVYSRKLPGCSRPEDGSINHFANWAILEGLEKFGLNLRKLYPEYYH